MMIAQNQHQHQNQIQVLGDNHEQMPIPYEEDIGMYIPHFPMEVCKLLHEIGYLMIEDDKHDIGYFQYYNRKGHRYRGKPAPHHEGALHHWWVGALTMSVAQIGGVANKISEFITITKTTASFASDEDYDEDEEDEYDQDLHDQLEDVPAAGQLIDRRKIIPVTYRVLPDTQPALPQKDVISIPTAPTLTL